MILLAACGSTGLVVGSNDGGVGSASPTASVEPVETGPFDPQDVWLVFGVANGKEAGIHAVRSDGSRLHRLPLAAPATAPSFSADRRFMAFAGSRGISVFNLAAGTSKGLTNGPDGAPAWAPSGEYIAFTRGLDIRLVRADGSGERPFVDGPPPGEAYYERYTNPQFTGDSLSVMFGLPGAIDVRRIDGSGFQRLFEPGLGRPFVNPSPDRTELVVSVQCLPPSTQLIVVAANALSRVCEVGRRVASLPTGERAVLGANGLVAYSYGVTIGVVPAAGGTPVSLVDTREALGGGTVAGVAWTLPGTILP
jgi:hypothetical protein